MGLPSVAQFRFLEPRGVDELYAEIMAMRGSLSGFPMDGLVVKVGSVALQQAMGDGPTAPRWALARKFAPPREETTLRNITWQVSRMGVLAPVAEFDPVILGGATIRRASLKNRREIERRDLRIGDVVWVEKAGEIIPQISGVELSKRPTGAEPYVLPRVCPSCEKALTETENQIQLICPQFECPEQQVQRLLHFVSKEALGIKGIGPSLARRLIDSGLVDCPGDLYGLTAQQLVALPGVALPGVGPAAAVKLADELNRADQLLDPANRAILTEVLGHSAGTRLTHYLAPAEVAAMIEDTPNMLQQN